MTVDNLTVITSNFKGIQSSLKILKLIQYFKGQIGSNMPLFFHST